MGCDIHGHLEVKIADAWRHYAPISLNRDYRVFAKMADVRNYDREITPIATPRGLPADITFLTRFERERWGSVGHSDSFLTAPELAELCAFFAEINAWPWDDSDSGMHWKTLGVWFFGNGVEDFVTAPQDFPGVQDVRLVFWFDN